jgi:hypothetical protein
VPTGSSPRRPSAAPSPPDLLQVSGQRARHELRELAERSASSRDSSGEKNLAGAGQRRVTSAPEASGCLVAPPVFKTGGRRVASSAGSIPVRLRQDPARAVARACARSWRCARYRLDVDVFAACEFPVPDGNRPPGMGAHEPADRPGAAPAWCGHDGATGARRRGRVKDTGTQSSTSGGEVRSQPASGNRSSRRAQPTTLSTALCLPTSSRMAIRSPPVVNTPAACRPPVLANIRWASRSFPGASPAPRVRSGLHHRPARPAAERRCRARLSSRRCRTRWWSGSCAAHPEGCPRMARHGPAGPIRADTATRHELGIERRELRQTLADTVRWLAARGLVTARQAGSLTG